MAIIIPNNEEVIVCFRRHWFVYFISAFPSILVVIVFVSIIFIAEETLSSQISNFRTVAVFIISAVVLFEWSILFIKWVNYALDIWIVTKTRIFDIEQHALFFRDVSEFRLDRIQDITVEVNGVIPTFLDFGDVHVQTAGKSRDFIFRQVPDPYGTRDKIAKEVDRALKETNNPIKL